MIHGAECLGDRVVNGHREWDDARMQITAHVVTGVGPTPYLSTIKIPRGSRLLSVKPIPAGLSSFVVFVLGDQSAGLEKRQILVMRDGDVAPSGITPGALIGQAILGLETFHLFDQGS